MRLGRFSEAVEILQRVSGAIPQQHLPVVLFNAGLALLRAGRRSEAESTFAGVAKLLARTPSGRPGLDDLPSVADWVTRDFSIEDLPADAHRVLQELRPFTKGSELERLSWWYEEAASHF